jgi:hypothetical protein
VWANYTCQGERDDLSELPQVLYDRVVAENGGRHRQTNVRNAAWCGLLNRAAAMRAFRAAFEALTAAERAACWAWVPETE